MRYRTLPPPLGLVDEICPSCDGSGIGMCGPVETSTCRDCRGEGIVWVEAEEEDLDDEGAASRES